MVGLYNSNSYGIKSLNTASNTKTDSASNQGGGGGGNFYQGDPEMYNDDHYVENYETDSNSLIINKPFDPKNIVQIDPNQVSTLVSTEISFDDDISESEDEQYDSEEFEDESTDPTGTVTIKKIKKQTDNQYK